MILLHCHCEWDPKMVIALFITINILCIIVFIYRLFRKRGIKNILRIDDFDIAGISFIIINGLAFLFLFTYLIRMLL